MAEPNGHISFGVLRWRDRRAASAVVDERVSYTQGNNGAMQRVTASSDTTYNPAWLKMKGPQITIGIRTEWPG